MTTDAVGEIEKDGNVLVVKRIHVTYHLKAKASKQATARRVLGFHAEHCPVARTMDGCVDITTSLKLEVLEDSP